MIKYRNLDQSLQTMVDQGRYAGAIERGANVDPWYVDLNRKQQGGGRSWDDAFNTYAAAFVAVNAWFAVSNERAWAKRGTIYCCSDGETESIVTLPRRCDVIGVGTDTGTFPKITGTHTVAAAPSGNGVRLINLGFIAGGTTAPILTLPSGLNGVELHHIHLYKAEGSLPTSGLTVNTSRDWTLNDVNIYPDAGAAKCTIGLNISGTTSGHGRSLINKCLFVGAEAMNVVDTSAYFEGTICRDSIFIATALCVDDNSDAIAFINNYLITEAAGGSTDGSGVVDWNTELICGNQVHASDADAQIPALDALT